MKNILSVLLLIFSTILFAQEKKSFDIEHFNELSISGPFKVEMQKGDKVSLTMESDYLSLDEVEIDERSDRLEIKFSVRKYLKDNFKDDDFIRVKIVYTSLEDLNVNMGAKVRFDEILKSEKLRLDVNMGGEITAEIDAYYLESQINMGGILELEGKIKEADLKCTMGGEFNGRDLDAEEVYAKVNMGGEIYISCSKMIDASVSMGGEITYYGDPEKSYTSSSMGGDIRKR